jgi:hypothetical protein
MDFVQRIHNNIITNEHEVRVRLPLNRQIIMPKVGEIQGDGEVTLLKRVNYF